MTLSDFITDRTDIFPVMRLFISPETRLAASANVFETSGGETTQERRANARRYGQVPLQIPQRRL